VEGSSKEGALKGGYVLSETEGAGEAKLVIAATGSEVNLAVSASKLLAAAGIKTRLVSIPCMEKFDAQSDEYRSDVFLGGKVPVLSIEAAAPHGWQKYSHAHIGMDRFGASGKGGDIFKKFGFTPENVVKQASEVVKYYSDVPVPNLLHRPKFANFVTGH
jgi:transketolase